MFGEKKILAKEHCNVEYFQISLNFRFMYVAVLSIRPMHCTMRLNQGSEHHQRAIPQQNYVKWFVKCILLAHEPIVNLNSFQINIHNCGQNN